MGWLLSLLQVFDPAVLRVVHDVHDDFRVLWLEYQGRPETDSRLSAAPDKDAALAHAKDKRVAFGLARSVNSNEGT